MAASGRKKISREEIIHTLSTGLKKNKAVFALWLEGADSNNTVDKFSDIDVWFDVADGKEKEVFRAVERVLRKLDEVTSLGLLDNPNPQIMTRAYHLAHTPSTLLIDICIQRHSRKFVFIKEHTHEYPKVLFDKHGVIKFKNLYTAQERQVRKKRIEHLWNTYSQQSRIIARVKRKDFLEALLYYHKWALAPLVELLRIRYSPLKREYHLKHVSRDLPKKVVSQLEDLYRVASVEDIQSKLKGVDKLFWKIFRLL